jgi:two-component system sensor histidine kinase KdpD
MRLVPYLVSAASVALAVVAGHLIAAITPLPDLSMIFLLAVIFSALFFGMWPAIFGSVLSFLCYDFFFIEPLHTFTIAEPYEFLALLVFLIVAIITSALAGRVRDHARIAASRLESMRRLYEFSRKIAGAPTVDATAQTAVAEIGATMGAPCVILLSEAGKLELAASSEGAPPFAGAELDAAQWAFAAGEPSGSGTPILSSVPWLFLPLRSSRRSIGVVGIWLAQAARVDSEQRALFETLVEQAAAALDRASLATETVKARAAAATERIRNTLLASISHDFRTPLAAILGSATSLLGVGESLDAGSRDDLLRDIRAEAERLDRMVRDLLAITRIDAGELELRSDWVDAREILERVIARARRREPARLIELAICSGLPLIRADARLLEQAFSNVLENALVHTPETASVRIDALAGPAAVEVRVTDDGPGIPPETLPRIFEKFARGHRETDRRVREGTGLGLAIAKGIIEAHKGSIAAESPISDERGTRIVLKLPCATEAS